MTEALLKHLVAKFKEGWGTANWLGLEGSRTLVGIGEVLPDVLLAYSEWVDEQGLMVPGENYTDPRTHEQLVADFLKGA